ncbi:hypothetical protein PR202_ga05552 [Eleusine coracana subsp. coracana]|uniref:Uncharacterized protein n=1 Tax=Eleusine coracana subsp. coracana TaxID=191504 RepID=A0AAV5BTT0_ELECO|nr:hypothetical protein PR202_ga05099 [Eleusine coracana subsp. coracana]GJM89366.1 hypothetical protein PR202_ga05552 [Eleusine coracana subsp. coracana]
MRRCLVDRFGFDEAGIRVLLDADPAKPQPTGANIRRNSSGSSGTRSSSTSTATGCDQHFKELVAKVPDGCLFTRVLDSCHSGGIIEWTKE